MTDTTAPRLRIARPTRDLETATAFYTRGLGLRVLASFENHAGIDGVILGHPNCPYHLEFTRRHRDPLTPTPTPEDLLVIYLPDHAAWASAVEMLRAFGAREVMNTNPYWREHGLTFADPDGNLVVLQHEAGP